MSLQTRKATPSKYGFTELPRSKNSSWAVLLGFLSAPATMLLFCFPLFAHFICWFVCLIFMCMSVFAYMYVCACWHLRVVIWVLEVKSRSSVRATSAFNHQAMRQPSFHDFSTFLFHFVKYITFFTEKKCLFF